MIDGDKSPLGVSPVVAVILMVAVTVVLSAAIGAFVFDLGQSTTESKQHSLGISTQDTSNGLEVTVVTGSADNLRVLLNGEPANVLSNPQAGDSLVVDGWKGDEVTIVETVGGEQKVISTTTIGSTADHNTGLVAHYRFGAGTGDIAYDTAGSTDGEIVGAAWTQPSPVDDSVLRFNGSSYVDLNTQVLPDVTTEPFTVSYWVRIDSGGNGVGVAQRDRGDDGHWEGFSIREESADTASTTQVIFEDASGNYLIVDYDTPPSEVWVHRVVTYDGSQDASGITVYENGTGAYTTVNTNNAIDNALNNPDDTSIGARDPDNPDFKFEGQIDDVRIFDRELSLSEVQELYNATK